MKPRNGPERLWRIGCAGFSMSLPTYFARLSGVEVQETFYDPPTERTLKRWRRQAPEDFAFAIRAWQLITHPPNHPGYHRIRRSWEQKAQDRFGLLRPTEQTQWAWGIVRRSAEILDAKVIVFHTPASFTPTRENRANFLRFFGSIDRGPCHLVWEPDGMWEDEEIQGLCSECGLIAGVDPLARRRCPQKGIFYFRIREKTFTRGSYAEADFSEIHYEAISRGEGGGEGFFIWNTRDAARDALRFQRWCEDRA